MTTQTHHGSTPTPLRVLHLVGSATSAFHDDLSRLYARDALAAVADPSSTRWSWLT